MNGTIPNPPAPPQALVVSPDERLQERLADFLCNRGIVPLACKNLAAANQAFRGQRIIIIHTKAGEPEDISRCLELWQGTSAARPPMTLGIIAHGSPLPLTGARFTEVLPEPLDTARLALAVAPLAGGRLPLEKSLAEPVDAPATTTGTQPDTPCPLEYLPVPVWRCDDRGQLDYVNAAWITFHGVSGCGTDPEKRWLSHFHEDDREVIAEAVVDLINNGTPFSIECQAEKVGGTYTPVTLTANPAPGGGAVGTLIPDALRTEAPSPPPAPAAETKPEPEPSSKPSESAKLASVLAMGSSVVRTPDIISQSCPLGIIVADASGALVFANDQHTAIVDADARTFDSLEDWITSRATDPQHAEGLAEEWQEQIVEKKKTRILPLLSKNGQVREIEIRPAETPLGGRLFLLEDVTEKHLLKEALTRSEERFRKLFRTSVVATATVGPRGSIDDATAALEELTGHPRRELLKIRLHDCLHPEDTAVVDALLKEFRNQSTPESIRRDLRCRSKSGGETPVTITATPLVNNGDSPPYLAVTFLPR